MFMIIALGEVKRLPYIAVFTCSPSVGRWGQEDEEFKDITLLLSDS